MMPLFTFQVWTSRAAGPLVSEPLDRVGRLTLTKSELCVLLRESSDEVTRLLKVKGVLQSSACLTGGGDGDYGCLWLHVKGDTRTDGLYFVADSAEAVLTAISED